MKKVQRFTMHGTSCGYVTDEPGDVPAIPGGGYGSNVRGAWRTEVGRYLEVSKGISRGELLFTEEPLFLCLGRSYRMWQGTCFCFWGINHEVMCNNNAIVMVSINPFGGSGNMMLLLHTPAMICLPRSSRAQCLLMVQERLLSIYF